MPKKKARFDWRFLLLLPIPVIWAVLGNSGHLDFIENRLVDLRFRARGEIKSPLKVVYVDIDSPSISELGNQPWPRSFFSRTCEALLEFGRVKAIGVDVVFSEQGVSESYDRVKWVESNLEFTRFLLKNPPVVVAASYSAREFTGDTGKLATRNLPLIRDGLPPLEKISLPEVPEFALGRGRLWTPARIGLIDTLEGGTRYVPMFAPTAVKRYDHMALGLALIHWGLSPEAVKTFDNRLEVVAPDGRLVAKIPLIDGQILEINWFSPWISPENNPRIGLSTVYNYARNLSAEGEAEKQKAREFFAQFADAIVLIGPVDPLLQDLATTPFDQQPMPKVGVHGNLLKTLVAGKFLKRLPEWRGVAWLEIVVVFALTLVTCLLAAAGGVKGITFKAAAALLLAGYVGLAFWLFRQSHVVLPLAAPLGAAFTTSFAAIVWQLIEEEKRGGRIKGMFGAYLAPALVNRMVESGEEPKLGGHEEEITAYFSDIQSFSTFSEKLGHGRLVELMNEYFTACTDILQAEGGTLDKYIGDAVVMMFGAPIPVKDHAYRACVASQRVHLKLAELRAKWQSEGDQWPEIVWKMQTRIGLNSGKVTVGNMGSRSRFNYTMMGDDVNLAARMESGAKQWGAYSMCSEATKKSCEQHGGDHVVFRPLGRIVVKGRTQAVPIYEIVGLREHVTEQTRECIRIFSLALEKHFARDWDGAIALFAQSRELEPNVPGKTPGVVSNPSIVYLEITEHYKIEPPPGNWDGVYHMKEK